MSYICIECRDNFEFRPINNICNKCTIKLGMISAVKEIESEVKKKEINKKISEATYSIFKEILNKVDSLSYSINYFRYYIILDFYSQVLWGEQEAHFNGYDVLKEVTSSKSTEDYSTLLDLNVQLAEQYKKNIIPLNAVRRGKFGRGNFVIDFIEFDSVLRNEMIELYDKYGDYGNFENKLLELIKSCEELISKISNHDFIYSGNLNEEKNHINLILNELTYKFKDREENYKKYSPVTNKTYKYSKLNTGNSSHSKEETANDKNTKILIIVIITFIIVGSIYFNNL